MPHLTIRRGPNAGTSIELSEPSITIGRGTRNDIVIQDTDVSRDHCRLFLQDGGYEIEDLGSTRGTFVDGQPVIGMRRLRSGSIIELGDNITLEYRHGENRHTREQPAVQAESAHARSSDERFLVMHIKDEVDRVYPLRSATVTVGRDLSNDIVIQDPEVSRWHLRLVRQADQSYLVEDLNSTNGTLINGARMMNPRTLVIYDVIQLGLSVSMHYVRDTQDIRPPQPIELPKTRPFTVDPVTQTVEAREASGSNRVGHKRQTSRLGTGIVQGALEGHVLIAYERADWEPLVAPLTVALQDAGIQVWVEQYLMADEADRSSAIDQALSECWLMVLVVTPQALESRDLRMQYRYFINRDKPVILLTYRPVERLPQELASLGNVVCAPLNPRGAFQRLIYTILQHRS